MCFVWREKEFLWNQGGRHVEEKVKMKEEWKGRQGGKQDKEEEIPTKYTNIKTEKGRSKIKWRRPMEKKAKVKVKAIEKVVEEKLFAFVFYLLVLM